MTESDKGRFAYLPVPEVVSRLGLYVTGVGTDVIPPDVEYPRQRHPELYDFSWQTGRVLPEFQFVLVTSGSGEFESRETGVVPVNAGSVMMLFPDTWHRYRPSKATGWTEYWISLGGDLLFQWHSRGLFNADRPLAQLRNPEAMLNQYQQVIDFVIKHPEQDAPLLTAHAMAVIANALEHAQTSAGTMGAAKESETKLDPIVSQSLQMIWNHSHQRVSIDVIAKEIGVNRRTLERKFRDQLGKTVLQELVACRIQRAKRLLGQTHVPIKYVAYASGFSSLSNLCKVFRREVGATPGEFRDSVTK